MRRHFLLMLVGLVLGPAPGLAIDLTKIERKIAKVDQRVLGETAKIEPAFAFAAELAPVAKPAQEI